MTHPPDPQLSDSIGNAIMVVTGVVFTLWRRRKQNETFADDVGNKVDTSIHTQVAALQASMTTTQNLVSIHTDKIKEANTVAGELRTEMTLMRQEMAAHTQVVQRGDDLVKQFNDYLERAKAGTLVEKPIAGSGGLATLKKKGE